MTRAPTPQVAAVKEPVAAMTTQIANALTVGSPLSGPELLAARDHYALLAELLLVSGPSFASMRAQAVKQHNTAVRRLREDREAERARAQARKDEDLVEIEA